MHISLDSELGRQRRLNQIGETISSIAAPTAAYSLRSLTGGDPRVVRVRRVRNDEQDFTVSGVSSGALVDFALNNTKSLLSSRAYFDGSNDNVGLTNEINLTGDFSVEYSFVVTETEQQIIGKNASGSYLRAQGTGEITAFRIQTNSGAESVNLTSNLKYGEANTVKLKRVSGKFGIYNESDVLISAEFTNSDTFTISSFGKARGSFAKGVIYNIRIDTNNDGTINHSYNGYGNSLADWQDLVGGNGAAAVNGSPALFTGQDQDGFVDTWYDQFGSRDAVQATASKQPLIVESGSLNVDSFSNPTIRFEKDSDTHFTTTDETLDPNLEVSAFVVQKDEQVANANSGWVAMRQGSFGDRSAFEMGVNNNSIKFRLIYDPGADNTNKTESEVTVDSDGLGTTSIMTGIKTSTGDLAGVFNGNIVIDTPVADNTDLGSGYGITIGKHNNSDQFADGRLNEVIFYLSDQTANRSAIETNLANHYGITLL